MKILRLTIVGLMFLLTSNISAQTVYKTKSGSKYHTNSCRYLKSSKYETTLDKALEYGLSACSVCKPQQKTSTKSNQIAPKKSSSVQCSGRTKAGNRCKRRTTNSSGRCYQH